MATKKEHKKTQEEMTTPANPILALFLSAVPEIWNGLNFLDEEQRKKHRDGAQRTLSRLENIMEEAGDVFSEDELRSLNKVKASMRKIIEYNQPKSNKKED